MPDCLLAGGTREADREFDRSDDVQANRLRRITAERQRKFMHEFYCALRIPDPEADPDFASTLSCTCAYVETLAMQAPLPAPGPNAERR